MDRGARWATYSSKVRKRVKDDLATKQKLLIHTVTLIVVNLTDITLG